MAIIIQEIREQIDGLNRLVEESRKERLKILKRISLVILLVSLTSCTVRGGWPRFLRPGESPGWQGPQPNSQVQTNK